MLYDAPVPYRVLLGKVMENPRVDADGFILWTALWSFECLSPMSNKSIVSPAHHKGGEVNMNILSKKISFVDCSYNSRLQIL